MQNVIEVHDLTKKYGDFTAVDKISFEIKEGEVFGLLGPNGAGKSTTIAMLTCLFPPTSGEAQVLGLDVIKDAQQIKGRIGVVPQDLALYPSLSGRDNLTFFGQMYGLSGKDLRASVATVLDATAMTERADDRVDTYSGGMKRRINLGVGLVHGPELLFLDEPTVGVDPQSRNHIFESIERLNQQEGMAILYTTHYMEEAERLCDRVAIIDRGQIIALDTPANLIALLGGGVIQLGLPARDEALCQAVSALSAVKQASFLPDRPTEDLKTYQATLKVEALQGSQAMIQILQLFNQKDIPILTLETLAPNLESVFLHLTGKTLRE